MTDHYILLLEDDPACLALMLRALEKADSGCKVHALADGEEAVAFLAERANGSKHALPSAVITDLKMPRKTGLEVLSWIRTQPSLTALPVYVLSTSNDQGDIDQAMSLGARAYFEKPLGMSELVEIARSILASKTESQSK